MFCSMEFSRIKVQVAGKLRSSATDLQGQGLLVAPKIKMGEENGVGYC